MKRGAFIKRIAAGAAAVAVGGRVTDRPEQVTGADLAATGRDSHTTLSGVMRPPHGTYRVHVLTPDSPLTPEPYGLALYQDLETKV